MVTVIVIRTVLVIAIAAEIESNLKGLIVIVIVIVNGTVLMIVIEVKIERYR